MFGFARLPIQKSPDLDYGKSGRPDLRPRLRPCFEEIVRFRVVKPLNNRAEPVCED
jgi:hypothetical protein